MGASQFDRVAAAYEDLATVQRDAGARLMALLEIGPTDDVLDLGCGPGNLTRELRRRTSGRVVGCDPSARMIAEALAGATGDGTEFVRVGAEELAFEQAFDRVFCNSAFQWFADPERALRNCRRALRNGGRLAVQAPATRNYGPNFVAATDALLEHEETRPYYARFRSPWFFLETAEEYAELARSAGLRVRSCLVEATHSRVSPEQAFGVFTSGAANGYFNPAHYEIEVPPAYFTSAAAIVAAELRRQADPSGLLDLAFHRVFLLAER